MWNKKVTLLGLALGVAALVACNDSVRPGGTGHGGGGMLGSSEVSGVWGGPHIEMVADQSGATIDYDCGVGAINGRLRPDARGDLVARGTHTFDSGGPYRVDEVPDTHPARYVAHVHDDTMTLTVTLTDTGLELGPFTLRRGERGDMYYCL